MNDTNNIEYIESIDADANEIMTESEFIASCKISNHDIPIESVHFKEETALRICEEFDIANYMAS